MASLKLRERAHGLGFGGHFLTKSRRYSTTMGALRKVRRDHVHRQLLGENGVVLDAWGRPEDDTLVQVVRTWQYVGWGYLSHGEAWLAATAAARHGSSGNWPGRSWTGVAEAGRGPIGGRGGEGLWSGGCQTRGGGWQTRCGGVTGMLWV